MNNLDWGSTPLLVLVVLSMQLSWTFVLGFRHVPVERQLLSMLVICLTNFILTVNRPHADLFYHRNIGGNKISIIFSPFFYFFYWTKLSLLAHMGSWQSALCFLIHIFTKFEVMVVSVCVTLCFCKSTMLGKKNKKYVKEASIGKMLKVFFV